MRQELRIAGFGGQGVVLAGYVLGKALALYSDKEAVMTQSHGPEARGGASSADLVVSTEQIAYPFVQNPDYLVALSQEAYTKFKLSVKPEAMVLIDRDLVQPEGGEPVYAIPATQFAEDMGRRIVANVVMLGYVTALTGIVKPGAMLRSLEDTLDARNLRLNIKAFEAGLEFQVQQPVQNMSEGT
jgi:2-oxoglutarate ferredoxin oxidoreductase subunit gamma